MGNIFPTFLKAQLSGKEKYDSIVRLFLNIVQKFYEKYPSLYTMLPEFSFLIYFIKSAATD